MREKRYTTENVRRNVWTENVGSSLEIDCDNQKDARSIDELIDFLNKSKKLGATHCYIECGYAYDGRSESVELIGTITTTETDDQLNARIEKMNKEEVDRVKKRDEQELSDYKRLKAKFEPNH